MTYQDAVSDLVRLWDLLPLLVGSPWSELEPSLLDALEDLAAAATDDGRERRAAQVLRLCRPYEPLRVALVPSLRRDVIRNGQSASASWAQTAGEIIAAIERSSRPAGDQWLVANLAGHAAGEPLHVGRTYDLTIGVEGDGPPADALAAEPVPSRAQHGPDAERTALTVELRGNADIEAVDPALTLPRQGASPDRARFRVTPRTGTDRVTLSAVVTRGGTFVQLLTMTARIADQDAAAHDGGPARGGGDNVRVRALGQPLGDAFSADEPDATLIIGDQDIWLIGYASHPFHAQLPPCWQRLQEIAAEPRAALEEIANGVHEVGVPAHQADVAISQEVYEEYLPRLVRAGILMFRALFFGPDAGEELKDLGRALETLMRDERSLWLSIVTKTPVVPWHLLAFQDSTDTASELPPILGLRHRISCPPMRRSTRRPPPSRSLRADQGPLRVVVAVNKDIDEHGGVRRDLVERQLTAWRRRADAGNGALLVTLATEHDVLDLLASSTPPCEIIYFFCHASRDEDPGRLGDISSYLEFTGRHKVSLHDLLFRAAPDQEFDPAPLVVLNACATTIPRTSVYGSFLLYLLGHGARGVIGTETDIPPVLAADWAQKFFTRALDGEPLADAVFEVTRDLVRRNRNLLGLAYALHCDGHSRVWPAVPRQPLTLAAQS